MQVIKKWDFPLLMLAVEQSHLLPEVQSALREAKNLYKLMHQGLVVEEILSDTPSLVTTIYPVTYGHFFYLVGIILYISPITSIRNWVLTTNIPSIRDL